MALKVRSIYPLDSSSVVIIIFESPSKSGSVNNKPVINCELIFPLTLNSPHFSFPSVFKSRIPSL